MSPTRARRLGRPPATNSAETRDRILTVAREIFAESGYGVTTNKDVAARAGITTGALYHYFDSKLDMYIAVYQEVQAEVDKAFGAALDTSDTFLGKLEAILDSAHQQNLLDPTLAAFIGSARIDAVRYSELREHLRSPGEGVNLVHDLVAVGLKTGEIKKSQQSQVYSVVRAFLLGLTIGPSSNSKDHRDAVDGFKGLLEATLLQQPRSVRRAAAKAAKA